MPFEVFPFGVFTEDLIDCRATEPRRFQTHRWGCEAGGCSVSQATGLLRQSKMDQSLFRQGMCSTSSLHLYNFSAAAGKRFVCRQGRDKKGNFLINQTQHILFYACIR
ncbi:hypothetical protein ETC05_05145 [Geobacillus sp. BMUD]|nr:hypothetical protein [Geobacillus sp. BMUD]